jgi:hypothetical protein
MKLRNCGILKILEGMLPNTFDCVVSHTKLLHDTSEGTFCLGCHFLLENLLHIHNICLICTLLWRFHTLIRRLLLFSDTLMFALTNIYWMPSIRVVMITNR